MSKKPVYLLTKLCIYVDYRLKVPAGCSTELSHKGQEFLTLLFMQHDRDRDGALSPSEMDALFSRCSSPPWSDDSKYSVVTNEKVWSNILEIDKTPTIIDMFLGLDNVSRIHVSMGLSNSDQC